MLVYVVLMRVAFVCDVMCCACINPCCCLFCMCVCEFVCVYVFVCVDCYCVLC